MQHDEIKPRIPMHVVHRSSREKINKKLRGNAFPTTAHVKTSAEKVFPKKVFVHRNRQVVKKENSFFVFNRQLFLNLNLQGRKL
jgi:hypothetical protein